MDPVTGMPGTQSWLLPLHDCMSSRSLLTRKLLENQGILTILASTGLNIADLVWNMFVEIK